MFKKLKRLMLGDPIASQREKHERLPIPTALAVFASDALSSTAYATEEILIALVGTTYLLQANMLSLPVAGAIALLMAIVVLSYRQVIKAFPEGGGTYEVSKERIGMLAAQIAGSALLIDYVLTVAVSVSAGVAAIQSAGFLAPEDKVRAALVIIFLMMLVNLRGVRESGKVLAFPAYFFILSMLTLIVMGFFQIMSGQVAPLPPEALAVAPDPSGNIWSMLLVLAIVKAFSHGCAALTGIEAISDGVKAFKEPSYQNANKTLVLMGVILGVIFISMTILAFQFHITPDQGAGGHGQGQTVISMIAEAVFGGRGWLFYTFQAATTVILILAANTSFSGFPRLANILANDGFLPRQLMNLGDRLVFSNGILILGVMSMVLVWAYHADTHSLIPLYAVGVFLSFTLAQFGMVILHKEEQKGNWKSGFFINALGALTTGIVTVILAVEKFTTGAWIVLVAIPIFVWLFRSVRAHYDRVSRQLALPKDGYCPIAIDHTVLVLVSTLHRGTIPALEYAKTMSTRVEAVHIELNSESTNRLKSAWDEWGCGVPLTVLKSPYRSISQPLLDYVDEVEDRFEHDVVTIIIPEFVTKKWWHSLMHNQTALLIKTLLRFKKDKVVTTVRYHLDE